MASLRKEEYKSDGAKKMGEMASGSGNGAKPASTVTNGETRERGDTALVSGSRSGTVDAGGERNREQQQQQTERQEEERCVSPPSEKPSSAVSSSVIQRGERRSSPLRSSTAATSSSGPRNQPPPPAQTLSTGAGIKESRGRGGDAAAEALVGREQPSSSSGPPRRGVDGADGDDDDDDDSKVRGVAGMAAATCPSSSSSEKAELVRLRELKAAFDKFDKNHDGKITKEELGDVLKVVGDEATDEELAFMITEVDKNGDGVIDWEEFVLLNTVDAGQRERELRAAFNVFDRDKNGYITVKELHQVLRNLDDDHGSITEDEVERMIARVDCDGDGNVDYEEFKRMMEMDISPTN